MATHVLRHIRQLVRQPETSATDPRLVDAVLLDRFARQQDEAAFAALVDRHGSMVLQVCRRVLSDHHTAQDVCQAVFLVLARKGFPAPAGRAGGVAARGRTPPGVEGSRRPRPETPS
jgi:hypothetical protein